MAVQDTDKRLEDSLVNRLRLQEGSALEELMHAYSARLRCVAVNILHNVEDADDVVHQSLWKAYQSILQYRQTAPLYTWLVSITRNECFALIRGRSVQMVSLNEERTQIAVEFIHAWGGTEQSPEQIVNWKEVAHLCRECMARLLPRFRTVVIMRLIEDRSNAEIADHLKISVSAVKVRYHRGRKQLCRLVANKLTRVPGFDAVSELKRHCRN